MCTVHILSPLLLEVYKDLICSQNCKIITESQMTFWDEQNPQIPAEKEPHQTGGRGRKKKEREKTMLATMGFILVIAMVVLIIRGKVALPPILIILPTIATFILGFAGYLVPPGKEEPAAMGVKLIIKTLQGYVSTGANQVLNTVALFTFAIVFFNILSDAGMFDAIVARAFKYIGNSIGVILFMTCLLATISHLDGSGATTWLITVPTMLPLFKKMKLPPTLLVLYVGLVSGTVNMLPWTSALARATAGVEGVEPHDVWQALVIAQVVGLIILYVSCFIVGPMLQKRGFGMTDEEFAAMKEDMLHPAEPVLKVSKTVLYIDMAMTLIIVIALLLGWVNTNLAFMWGIAAALLLNCHGPKEMTSQIKKHGANALNMIMILFSIGMLVGTMKDSGMMQAMTNTLVALVPESLSSHLMFIISLISAPLSMVVGSDSLYMIMTPIFASMNVAFGGTALAACCASVIGACLAANLCLVAPTPYLALGLAGVEMKDNLKFCFLPTWALSIVLAIVAALTGAFPF